MHDLTLQHTISIHDHIIEVTIVHRSQMKISLELHALRLTYPLVHFLREGGLADRLIHVRILMSGY